MTLIDDFIRRESTNTGMIRLASHCLELQGFASRFKGERFEQRGGQGVPPLQLEPSLSN